MIKTDCMAIVILVIVVLTGCCPPFPECPQCSVCPCYSGNDPEPADKTVFIEMQPWYGNPIGGTSESWYYWGFNNHDPGDSAYLANHGKRDIASVYYPLIGAYDSYDVRVIDWQIDICKAMLIDCMMIDYYGDGMAPESAEFRHYKSVTDRIIDRAERKGMKVVLLYETQVRKESADMANDILSDLNAIIDNTEWMNSKAYLHYYNIPVLSIFGVARLHHDEWSAIRDALFCKACLVADTQPYMYENPYQDNAAFNGCFRWDLYNYEIRKDANPDSDTVTDRANRLNNDSGWWADRKAGRFAFSMIWPGFDDTAVNGWGNGPREVSFFTSDHPEDDTSFYDATMQAALYPDYPNNWILIATLNDWNESTGIEPSREKGYALAIKTKQFAEMFKGVPDAERQPDSIIQTITEDYGFTYK